MSELKLNSINNISFAVDANTFKLSAGLVGPNNKYISVELDINPSEIKSKTLGELEEMALAQAGF